jgi:hypothetical protein
LREMIEEIICEDCRAVFYDWWDAENHLCIRPAIAPQSVAPVSSVPASVPMEP